MIKTFSQDMTELAQEMSEQVDKLRTERNQWRQALVEMASDLEPGKQLDIALMVQGVAEPRRRAIVRTFNEIRDGEWRENDDE